ncbi:MAG: hypothetical protein ABSE63_13690 [Thermoguttaceae bacterium]
MNLFNQINSPAAFVFIVVVLGISFILLMRTSRYFNRQRQQEPKWVRAARPRYDGSVTAYPRSGDNSTAAPATPPATSQRHLDASPKTAQWEVDMHETARELKAQLDSKMSALQALIAEADRAASRLEAAMESRDDTHNAPPSNRIPSVGSPLFTPKPGPPHMGEKNQAGLPTSQAQGLRPAPAPSIAGVSTQNRKQEIYALADYGLSDSAIAQRLGVPIGEVELILSLRGKK